MKNMYAPQRLAFTFCCLLSLFSFNGFAQVGIGTSNPNSNALLEIDASTNVGGLLLPRVGLSSTSSFSPLSAHVEGMTVYNTATVGDVRPGQYYNNGNHWIRIEGADPVESVSLGADRTISSTTFTPITGMTLQFTARKQAVLIVLSASGFGADDSMSLVKLRVMQTAPGSSLIGGTQNKIQSYDWVEDETTPQWSASFSKLFTGLTIGTTYTLRVEGLVNEILGTRDAYIYANSNSDDNHLTLSVIQ
jgi:hypothetical protein